MVNLTPNAAEVKSKTNVEYAVDYAKLGFSVVPVVQGTKVPPKGETWKNRRFFSASECPDEEWKGNHPDAVWGRATEAVIRAWWKEYPTAGIGILTGLISGIDVVDLDGPGARERLEAEAGVQVPDSISQTTGRADGGRHILFKYHNGGLVNKAGYVEGVDIRTDGGLFVVAPSIHKSGKRYQWDIDPTEMGLDDLEQFPPDLLSFLLSKCGDNDNGTGQREDRINPDKLFKEGIPAGRKHHDLFRYACQKIQQGITKDETLILTTELARICEPPPKDGPEKAARVRVDEAFQKYGKEHSATLGEEWKYPTDITRPIPPAPKFPLDCLPDVCRSYVEDVALRLQVSSDMVALPLLGQSAGLIGSGVVLRPKAKDNWEERACLWVEIIAAKSSMKSAALQAGTKELRRIQAGMTAEHFTEMQEWQQESKEIKLRKRAHEKKIKEILKKDPDAELPSPPESITDFPEAPELKRLVVNDTTIERLADLMQGSRGLTLFRDELSGFMSNMSRYNAGSDRQFYLECYSGGAYHVDRVGRGTQYIADLYLNIVGGIQPKVAREIFGGDAVDDGFFERFGLLAYPEKRTDWKLIDRYPDHEAQNALSEMCDTLANIVWEEHLPMDKTNKGEVYGKPFVRFDSRAQQHFNDWLSSHMKMVASLAEDDPLAGFFGKERGLLVRVVLVIHLATCASESKPFTNVTLGTLQKAFILFNDYVEPMWHRVMAAFGRTTADESARKIAEWIKEEKPESIKQRDILRKGWKELKDLRNIQEAIDMLITNRWLGEGQTTTPGSKGGRPSLSYPVNPLVFL